MIERLQVEILAGVAGEFLQSQLFVLTLIRSLFHPCVTTVALKRPWSFCQKCRWQVTPKYIYTLDPSKLEWADYAAVQAECGNLSGNKLTHNSSGITQSQLSQFTEPLWTDSGLKSGISLRKLISTLKKMKKKRAGREWSVKHSSKKLACKEKNTIGICCLAVMDRVTLAVMDRITQQFNVECPNIHSWPTNMFLLRETPFICIT